MKNLWAKIQNFWVIRNKKKKKALRSLIIAQWLPISLSVRPKPGTPLRHSWKDCSYFWWFGRWLSCFAFPDYTIPFFSTTTTTKMPVLLGLSEIHFMNFSMGPGVGRGLSLKEVFWHNFASRGRGCGLLFPASSLPVDASVYWGPHLVSPGWFPAPAPFAFPSGLCSVRVPQLLLLAENYYCIIPSCLSLNPAHAFINTVDPWTTQVGIVQVHLYTDFFQ